MKERFPRYAYSFGIAIILTVVVGVAASVSRFSAVGALLAPGMLAAAVLFPEGIHSDRASLYLVTSGLMNVFLLGWLLFWLWPVIGRARQRCLPGTRKGR
jgi:hypothetical protein